MAKASIRLAEAVELYLLDRQRRRKSASTIKADRSVLNGLVRVTGGGRWMAQVGAHEVDCYFATLGHLSGQAHNVYRARVKMFLLWCKQQGYVHSADECMSLVENMPETEPVKVWLDELQAIRLIESQKWERDRAFVAMALNIGARGSEMARLLIRDLDLDAGTVVKRITKLHKIARRDDVVALTPWCEAIQRQWLAHLARALGMTFEELYVGHPDYYLFPSRQVVATNLHRSTDERHEVYRPTRPIGQPWTIVGRSLKQMGIQTDPAARLGVHVLRRTAGQMARLKTGDIRVAQALLGHTSERTTEKYLDADRDKVNRNAYLRGGGWLTLPGGDSATVPSLRKEA